MDARPALVVADVGWYTTEHLFRAVDPARADSLLLRCMDFANARNKGIPPSRWVGRTRRTGDNVWERDWILPPGWMSRFPNAGMAPIAWSARRWQKSVGGDPTLIFTYPQYLTLRDQIEPRSTIYYNIDDYRLYWPDRAVTVEALETRAVRESTLTVCVANARAEELRRRVPDAADRVVHLPHGALAAWLSPESVEAPTEPPADVAHLPRPLIGYVGSLEDRVDWALLDHVAASFLHASFVLVGRVGEHRECLDRPNVHAIGWRDQSLIAGYNRAFDVALIPYRVDHPFNRACCPTKLMDTFATGRPIVSTAIPECLLHLDKLDVASTPEEFVVKLRAILAQGSDDGRGRLRFEYARRNTCREMSGRVLDALAARK